MHPQPICGIDPYLGFIVVACICGIGIAGRAASSLRLRIWQFFAFEGIVVLCALVGAKSYSVWFAAYAEGYRYPGGIIGAVAGMFVATRIARLPVDTGVVADALVPSIAVSLGIARLGCFVAGCCYGTVTDGWWGVQFPAGSHAWLAHFRGRLISPVATWSLAVHPLQIYFALLVVVAFVTAQFVRTRNVASGVVALTFLLVHDSGKALLEGLRDDQLSAPYLQSSSLVITALAAAMLLFRMQKTFRGEAVRLDREREC